MILLIIEVMYIYNAVAYRWNLPSASRVYIESVSCKNSKIAEDVKRRLIRLYSSNPKISFDIERIDVLESIEDFESNLPF